jgi:hypothetical protein
MILKGVWKEFVWVISRPKAWLLMLFFIPAFYYCLKSFEKVLDKRVKMIAENRREVHEQRFYDYRSSKIYSDFESMRRFSSSCAGIALLFMVEQFPVQTKDLIIDFLTVDLARKDRVRARLRRCFKNLYRKLLLHPSLNSPDKKKVEDILQELEKIR